MKAFSKLWETEELLCSFDGIKIDLPRRKDVKWTPWPHCDHNPDVKGYVVTFPVYEQRLMIFAEYHVSRGF